MTIHPVYRLFSWLILFLGLMTSCITGYWMKNDVDAHEYQRFLSYCDEVKLKIVSRLKAHEQMLLSGSAMFDASEEITRKEWQLYAKRLHINEHFQGIQGLGFSLWIPAKDLAEHEARTRAKGFPNYHVWPQGQREFYSSIFYLEPFTGRNLRAFGYDMFSEPVRRAAMEKARDENTAALSRKVTLVQETKQDMQAGTLMYVPVYQKNKPIDTVEQRRSALYGWVYSPFRMTDLLNNIIFSTFDIDAKHIRLSVYDSPLTTPEHLLYDSNPNYQTAKYNCYLEFILTNDFRSTEWTLKFEQSKALNQINYQKAWVTFGSGLLVTTLLFLLSRSYLNTQIHAIQIANQLTEQLQESEKRFRVLADSAPVLIWLSGVDKLCYQFNKTWLEFTGRSLEQEYGHGWTQGVHPDDFDHCLEIYVTSFDARQPFTMEYRLRRYDGEYRWLLDTGTPRFAYDGVFLGYIGSCIDITERKLAMQEVLKSREQLADIIAGTNAGTWEWNVQTGEVRFNQNWATMIGYTLDELQPISIETWIQVCHPEDLKKSDQLLKQHFAGEIEYYACECRLKHKNGHWVWVFDRGKIIAYTDDGKPLLMAGTHIDISTIKETEEQLRIAASVFESHEGMMVADATHKVLKANTAFTKITGYTAEELIGQTPRLFHSGRQGKVFYEKMWQSINETGMWQGQIWNKRKDGEIYPAWLTITAVLANGHVTHYVSTLSDISDLKQIENELRESQLLLQTAQRAAMLGHYVLDLKDSNAITWTNDAIFDEIFGINEDFERVFKNLELLVHPSDLNSFKQNFLQIFDYKRPSGYLTDSIEYRIIRPIDGKKRWIRQWYSTFYDENGYPNRQIGMIQDITDLKKMEEILQASATRFRSIIDISPVPMLLNDQQGNLIFINPAFAKTFGYEIHEIPTLNHWYEKTYPDVEYREYVTQLWTAQLKNIEHEHSLFKPLELNMRCKNGTERTVLGTASALPDVEFGKQYLIMLYDITERKQIETELRIAATVFESQEGMVITDANETILNVNQAFTQITGYTAQEVIGQTPRILKSGKHNNDFYDAIWQDIQNTGAWQGEIWNRRKNGEVYPEHLTITAVKNDENIITHYVATMSDITERKAAEEHIHRLAFYDALTQLPNRRLLHQRLAHGLELYRRNRTQMAVLMIDLDKFKAVNDTLGHAAGDELLIQVTQRIKSRLREVDMVARLGGDEFVILLDDIKNYDSVSLVADAVIHTLSQTFTLGEKHQVHIGASIGIAIHPEHGNTEEDLMDNADRALYKAKDLGRGCFVYFSDELRKKIND